MSDSFFLEEKEKVGIKEHSASLVRHAEFPLQLLCISLHCHIILCISHLLLRNYDSRDTYMHSIVSLFSFAFHVVVIDEVKK